MTPKEKAKELYFKMYNIYGYTDYHLIAKQCALIAVDEILEECRLEIYLWWREVKQEIIRL